MASSNYWDRFSRSRLSRRRAMAGAGGLGLTAATLALLGCSSDDSSPAPTGTGTSPATGGGTGGGSTGGDADSGLLSRPVNSTDRATPGGTIRDFQNAEMHHFDVLQTSNNPVINFSAVFAYPRLLKFTSGEYPNAAEGISEGEVATDFEMGADQQTLTLHLRRGMKWDARSPTNGREIDAQDVLFSWNKYVQINASAQDLAYNPDSAPGAPIEGISAPDDHTIVFHLRQFDSSLIQLLTSQNHFYVMPRESDGEFDPMTDIRGHGPWILDEYVASSRVVWSRNPDYYIPNRPFPDRLERPIVLDYSQRLAQFVAGNIWTTVTSPEEVVQVKRDASATLIHQAAIFSNTVSPFITFGWDDDSPFRDTRMRQALSMLLDREAFTDVVENREGFAREGLDLEVARNTVVAPGQGAFWLDPDDTAAFGENHRFLKYDPEEAHALMEAAGYGDGASFNVYYNTENTYGAIYHQILDIYEGMLGAGGMTLVREGSPYAFYRDNIYDFYLSRNYANRGDRGLSGIVHKALRGFPTVATGLFSMLHPDGGFYQGVSPDGNNVERGDPELNDLIQRIKQEPDREQQHALVHDVIRNVAGNMYNVPRPTMSKLFSNWWPAIGNVGLNSTLAGGNIWVEERINWWVDSSQPPLG